MASQAPFNPFGFNPFQHMMQAYFASLDSMAQSGQTWGQSSGSEFGPRGFGGPSAKSHGFGSNGSASRGADSNGAANPGFGTAQAFNQIPAFNPMLAMEPMMKGMARCQLEYMGFAAKRAQAYMEIPSRLALVRTPQDLMHEQTRFWQTAAQQYQDSSRRIMAAATSMVPQQGFATGEQNAKAKRRDYMSVDEPAEPAPAPTPARASNGAAAPTAHHAPAFRVARGGKDA